MSKTFDDHLANIQGWMEDTAETAGTLDGQDPTTERYWCTLGITDPLIEKTFQTYFDRTDLGAQYSTDYATGSDAGPPTAFLQMDSDLLFTLQKCFTLRYRGRLMNYRDDCSQKKYHTYSALTLGAAKYTHTKLVAAQTQSQTPSTIQTA